MTAQKFDASKYDPRILPHMFDPEVSHNFKLVTEGERVMPNQDPDSPNGGARLTPDESALVSDPCAKRSMKDVMEDVFGEELYLSRKAAMKGETGRGRAANIATATDAVAKYTDVRLFGGVVNPGGRAHQILGPVQLEVGVGVGRDGGPVHQHTLVITRLMDQTSRNATAMGRKTVLDYVRVTQEGRYAGYLGKRHNVSRHDMGVLWTSIMRCAGHRPSASRGFMRPVSLQVVTFDNEFGGVGHVAHNDVIDLSFDPFSAEPDAKA